jgi:hypothetical protein
MAYVRQHPDYPKFRKKVGVMPDFSGANIVDQETPSGVMDGVNKVFTLAHLPIQYSERVYKDGMMMARASTMAMTDGDYYIDYTTGTITFSSNQIPQPTSVIRVCYKHY